MTDMSTRPASPTLDEVAVLAGVSRATVSRVVNDSPRVSPEARAAVRSAIAELRYVPNRMARSLVTRRTDTIALVLNEPNTQVFSDPFFASIVRGVSATLADTDLNLVLLTAQDEREQQKIGRYARQGHVDGVILMSVHSNDPLPDILAEAGVPLVMCGRPFDDRAVAYVDADNRGGAEAATAHLIATGRNRIATITGPLDMIAGVDRLAGHRAALTAAGRQVHPELEAEGDFTEVGGARAMESLLARDPELDAVFVASDPMAVGALGALRAAGRRVPQDVAVVGFDDAAVATRCDPPLTTIAQPLTDMTPLLTELLLRQIEGVGEPAESRVCHTSLVRRASA
ncbi:MULTISPECIES: LacI family DNA-binding transcriptional regulator [unclassified Modestobacter]|uniref:LacI family DNA-binding transcriptional regulator n=1 Tax=unclassified Modestobacter TaxID=2643866 RepID=UPI0022AA2673|nr:MULTISPECIES: LacI family DNA-binding transcriptional regulator [unclassified Modestobacter]MCZ2825481.1 LacI family DNA-binding transcriptional regulator [Modestobacter sp. VKM Ac-2981]MCZ2853454.1 LacI family DNA-binding transcriptional regulator [Modestobacter sp. VKM Ac-2982]